MWNANLLFDADGTLRNHRRKLVPTWAEKLVWGNGDAFDLVYRSNTKNLKTVKKHLDKHHPQTRVIDQ